MPRILLFSILLLVATWSAAEPAAGQGDAEQAVRQADLAFAQALKDRDRDAFAALIAEDGVFFGGASAHHGPNEVLEAWAVYFKDGGPTLSWAPEKVEVNEARGLATTTGPYTLTLPDAESGTNRVLRGTYFTVWRLHPAKGWQALFDTGTAPEAVQSSD